MTLDRRTGVWSVTVPLPSGVFNYDYVFGCTENDELESATPPGCTRVSDPANPPWNARGGVAVGSIEPTSQVYVPSDRRFHTVDYSWQGPRFPRGSLRDVYYPALATSPDAPAGLNNLAIYTPPRYDAHRQQPYPTLYLSPGFGGNEIDWSTRPDAGNILDNLIDTRRVEPMVVVMTNFVFSDCAAGDGRLYSENLLQRVVPYVESHYRVGRTSAERAFAGLSCGGGLAASLLSQHTRAFSAFGLFSPTPYVLTPRPGQVRALRSVRVMVGAGKQDPIHFNALDDVAALRSAGVPVVVDFINGGHDWSVWRILLRDFLTRVAFRS